MKLKLFVIFTVLFTDIFLYALEVKSIKIIGKSVDVDLSEVTEIKKNQLSENEIKLISSEIIDKYHNKGYTAAFVKEIILKKSGILEIYIIESGIHDIRIHGLKENKKEKLAGMLLLNKGEIYNEFILKMRVEAAKRALGLSAIYLYPERNEDNNLILKVNAKEKGGSFYGSAGTDMIYGISSLIGYYIPFYNTSFDIKISAGYKENEFRKLEGEADFFYFQDNRRSSFIFGIKGGKIIDHWESYDLDYRQIYVQSQIGFGYGSGVFSGFLFLMEQVSRLDNYKEHNRHYDSSITLEINFSNNNLLLNKKEAYVFKASISSGWENLEREIYAATSINGSLPYYPVHWLRLVPGFNLKHTSSNERIYWSYVFDNNLMGFFNDYTSSKWKNIIGLDSEIEISRSLLYIGPFINYGYFLNEYNEWKHKTGAGVKCIIEYEKILINIYYSWNIEKRIKDGSLFFTITGRF